MINDVVFIWLHNVRDAAQNHYLEKLRKINAGPQQNIGPDGDHADVVGENGTADDGVQRERKNGKIHFLKIVTGKLVIEYTLKLRIR
jgi:hypothetical protein